MTPFIFFPGAAWTWVIAAQLGLAIAALSVTAKDVFVRHWMFDIWLP